MVSNRIVTTHLAVNTDSFSDELMKNMAPEAVREAVQDMRQGIAELNAEVSRLQGGQVRFRGATAEYWHRKMSEALAELGLREADIIARLDQLETNSREIEDSSIGSSTDRYDQVVELLLQYVDDEYITERVRRIWARARRDEV